MLALPGFCEDLALKGVGSVFLPKTVVVGFWVLRWYRELKLGKEAGVDEEETVFSIAD